MLQKNKRFWIVWIIVTVVISVLLSYQLLIDEDKSVFLPAETSHGHYQIEMACATCHTESFTDKKSMQRSCIDCHGKELKEVDDSHPKSKFTDPRNADRVAKLDARYCVTCHGEHKPKITGPMGVTVQQDICVVCHQDIADDRKSHEGLSFMSCASSGCHNFHDNKALYEDFLLKHVGENSLLEQAENKRKNFRSRIAIIVTYPIKQYPLVALDVTEKDMPVDVKPDQKIVAEWSSTVHAKSGVNCTACHNEKDKQGAISWQNIPSVKVCKNCHDSEAEGFLMGKHGMRLAQGLSPMRPDMARSEMKSSAHGKELSCSSCHSSHLFNIKSAAVEACLRCHNDKHSLAYKKSPHFESSYTDLSSGKKSNTAVTCATCHMPRIEKQFSDGSKHVIVQHNQNENLRPNEKMIRSVCMNCHGLSFSIDALADVKLIENNFSGLPNIHIKSIDMAVQREVKKH